MTWRTIRDRIELALPNVTMIGVLAHNRARASLIVADHETGEAEVLSVDLTVYGYVAAPGEVFVKGWSEHSGLATALEKAGVARIVETVLVGPFGSQAHRMQLLSEGGDPVSAESSARDHAAAFRWWVGDPELSEGEARLRDLLALVRATRDLIREQRDLLGYYDSDSGLLGDEPPLG